MIAVEKHAQSSLFGSAKLEKSKLKQEACAVKSTAACAVLMSSEGGEKMDEGEEFVSKSKMRLLRAKQQDEMYEGDVKVAETQEITKSVSAKIVSNALQEVMSQISFSIAGGKTSSSSSPSSSGPDYKAQAK